MTVFDVFNGDADGICALVQLRKADPKKSRLITGVKRDIQLLDRVEAGRGDQVNVLDISMEKNRSALDRLLNQGVELFYVDHHRPGVIPEHAGLTAIIDTDPETCTSLLVNNHLGGQFLPWAITAAFGDNMTRAAELLCKQQGYSSSRVDQLKTLGICLNYNGYGEHVSDLHIPPDRLYLSLMAYDDPLEVVSDPASCFQQLNAGYLEDLDRAGRERPAFSTEAVEIVVLPNESWARRVSGVLGNQLANANADKAHAVMTPSSKGGYVVSVRAPLNNRTGADQLCSQFPSGGGRQAAAGINHLPLSEFDHFASVMQKMYGSKGDSEG
ncbi:MAG: DHH family phosphoesterase [Sedimenticola sp.]|nr:DHH family phosphoesterase [Sedimenticola sp.]